MSESWFGTLKMGKIGPNPAWEPNEWAKMANTQSGNHLKLEQNRPKSNSRAQTGPKLVRVQAWNPSKWAKSARIQPGNPMNGLKWPISSLATPSN